MNPPSGDATFELFVGDGRRVGGGPSMVLMVPAISFGSVRVWPGELVGTRNYRSKPAGWLLAHDDGDVSATEARGSMWMARWLPRANTADHCLWFPMWSPLAEIEEFGPYHHPWIGDIDEVSIYNRALEPSEVTNLCLAEDIDSNDNDLPDVWEFRCFGNLNQTQRWRSGRRRIVKHPGIHSRNQPDGCTFHLRDLEYLTTPPSMVFSFGSFFAPDKAQGQHGT